MISYTRQPSESTRVGERTVDSFGCGGNIDRQTVQSFGEEWSHFSQFSDIDLETMSRDYFDILPDEVVRDRLVLDVGCGTGRWSKVLARRAGFIECIDPSAAAYVAAEMLAPFPNTRVSQAGVDDIPFADDTFDLVMSLGVLHHVPDTEGAVCKCVRKVKPGGAFLVYLYYSLQDAPRAKRAVFQVVNRIRLTVSSLPKARKQAACATLAATIYLPLCLLGRALTRAGAARLARRLPLSWYQDKSFWVMRNDALDRFGTPLEKRFTREEVVAMLREAGLTDIKVSDGKPYWHAIGYKPGAGSA